MNIILQPDCLRWARERAKLTRSELAQKLDKEEEQVASWEQTGEISWSTVQRLAVVTFTPLGYLFLPEPPTQKLPINDFRTVQSQDISVPSTELLDVVNDALQRQDWYRDYIISNGGEPLPFVGSLQVSDDITGAARRIRDVVGLDALISEEYRLSRYVSAVEDADILVMRSGYAGGHRQRILNVDEFRGFALADEFAPLIFINSRDAKSAQLFTLAHELVHIWLGVSGISNLDKTYSPDIEIERFCNKVAAELLVPSEDLKTVWAKYRRFTEPFGRIAKHFRVSQLVILRRLYDMGYLTYQDFQKLYTEKASQVRPTRPKRGGANYYRTLSERLGRRFVSALVASTLEGRTPYREAFHLLGVRNAEKMRRLAATMETTA